MFFFLNYVDVKDGVLEKLNNVFYIVKKGSFNLLTGDLDLERGIRDYSNDKLKDISGNIISKNLQLLIKFKVEVRETDFKSLNSEII